MADEYDYRIDVSGGTGGTRQFYCIVMGGAGLPHESWFYSDPECENRITKIVPPTYSSTSIFIGCAKTTGGSEFVVSADGTIDPSWIPERSPRTIYARFELSREIYVCGTTLYYMRKNVGSRSRFHSDAQCMSDPVTSIIPPTRFGSVFMGGYVDETLCVNSDGTFTDAMFNLPDGTWDVLERWRLPFVVTVNADGGTGGVTKFYYGASSFYADEELTQEITSVSTPTIVANTFIGMYLDDGTTEAVDANGLILPSLYSHVAERGNTTIRCHYRRHSYALTLSKAGGSGGTDALYRSTGEVAPVGWYLDATCQSSAASVIPPTRTGFVAKGAFTESSGGTIEILWDGSLTSAFESLGIEEDTTFYWQWQEPYRISVSANSGTGGTSEFYFDPIYNRFYGTAELSSEISSITPHSRPGYLNIGCYSTDGTTGTLRVTPVGTVVKDGWSPTSNETIYAQWELDPDHKVEITLDPNGGTVSQTTVWCPFLRPMFLPHPEHPSRTFLGWYTSSTGGTRRAAGDICDNPVPFTLHAHWTDDVFGNLTDWFGLETADGPLMLVASNDGATRSVVETSHTGALAIQTASSSVGAFERGGILLNPTCTYRIRKSGTVQLNPGKAYGSATIDGTGTSSNPYRVTKSGYMLVQAEYGTAADGEPALVVRGAANEGHVWRNGRMVSQLTDAINQWTVSLDVDPDHVAQDPMGAVSGGGEMTECKTLVTCDPVVPMENGMPCASDVVHGKVVVTATTNAYFGESAPTAGGSFVETNGTPNSETDVDFTTYAFTAERSL